MAKSKIPIEKNRQVINGTVEYQQEYEFIQDPKYPLTDDGIKSLLVNHYISLYPIYEDAKRYVNTIFIIKTSGKIFGTVRTLKK